MSNVTDISTRASAPVRMNFNDEQRQLIATRWPMARLRRSSPS